MGSGERYEKTQYGGAPHCRRGRRHSLPVDAAVGAVCPSSPDLTPASYDVNYLTIVAPAPKGDLR